MTASYFGWVTPIDRDTDGPDTFIISEGSFQYRFERMLGGDVPVWRANTALYGIQDRQLLYLFQMAGSLFIVQGDDQMAYPKDVQAASSYDQPEILYGSWYANRYLDPGNHNWDVWNAELSLW